MSGQSSAYELGYLGHHGVPEDGQATSSQSSGNPINQATHVGFSLPPVGSLDWTLRVKDEMVPLALVTLWASSTVGVGHIPRALAAALLLLPPSSPHVVGVGHNEDPVTEVRGTNSGRRDALPFSVVPAGDQVPEYVAHSSNKEPWDVLHEDVPWS
jgi:hypothetical protein